MYLRAYQPPSSSGDAISFAAALILCIVLVGASVLAIWGCYRAEHRRLGQFVTCGLSFLSSVTLLYVVSFKVYVRHQGAYLGLLFFISGSSGLFEVEALWHLFAKMQPRIHEVLGFILALICVLTVIGSIGSSLQNQDLLSIWTLLLFATSAACYFLVGIGYVILCHIETTWSSKCFIFSTLGVPCFLVLIPSGALVVNSLTGSRPGPLFSAWVFSILSSISTLRLYILRPLKIYARFEKHTSREVPRRALDIKCQSNRTTNASSHQELHNPSPPSTGSSCMLDDWPKQLVDP